MAVEGRKARYANWREAGDACCSWFMLSLPCCYHDSKLARRGRSFLNLVYPPDVPDSSPLHVRFGQLKNIESPTLNLSIDTPVLLPDLDLTHSHGSGSINASAPPFVHYI